MQNHVIGEMENICCPLCGCCAYKFLFYTKDYTFAISGYRFEVRKCRSCGCGYLSPRPTETAIRHYYPDQFYWSWEREGKALPWEEILARRAHQNRAKAVWLEGIGPGRLLDVGAQKGEFMWYMRQLGWEVEGVEIDNRVPNPGNMPIRYGDFLQMDFEPGSFDAITMWAVLEHVHQPSLFIERSAQLLRKGGRIVVLVTNLGSIQSRFFRLDDFPRHLTVFTKKSIRKLFTKHGLKIIRIHTGQEIFGGSLSGSLVYLIKRLGGYSEDEAFREWKQPFDPMLFWTQWRGRPSRLIRMISKIDRALTWPLEVILDRIGMGFILTVSAEKI